MLRRLMRVAVVLVLIAFRLVTASLACTWLYTTTRLEMAKHEGIYATPEEGMRARIARGWKNLERIEIQHAGPNRRDGRDPHVWYVTAKVWAESRADGSQLHERGYDHPGSFFLGVEEGWVYVPEGAFPEFIGFGMRLFGIRQTVEHPAGPLTSQSALGTDFLRRSSSHHIRVMSFNVGWDSIFPDDDPQNDRWRRDSKPAEFVRIVRAIAPDILCLQEINPARNPEQVAAILDAASPLDNGETWQAHSGHDNVIAARFDLLMRADQLIRTGAVTNFGHAMALIDLPDAEYEVDLYVICAHFKSQGGQANIEARQEHADAIIRWIDDLKTPGGEIDLPANTPVIVLGDLNVYDTDPARHLTTLLTGDIVNEDRYGSDILPDWDNTHLADALPRHNGVGEDVYTWRDDTQDFNPGVLDRILYTDSVLLVENGFVLNTTIMTEPELDATGLEASDVMLDPQTGRYDHLPVVVDIVLREAEGQ